MSKYEVVQDDDTDVLFGNPFEGEDLEDGGDFRDVGSRERKGDDYNGGGLRPMSLEYVSFFFFSKMISVTIYRVTIGLRLILGTKRDVR